MTIRMVETTVFVAPAVSFSPAMVSLCLLISVGLVVGGCVMLVPCLIMYIFLLLIKIYYVF